jgi:hypothetical protein
MTTYTIYNFIFAAIALPISLFLVKGRMSDFFLSARVGVLLMLLGYPWDFFAIQLNIWRYVVDPGARLFAVPLNDLAFMWLCSHLASSVLVAVSRSETLSGGHSKSKYASDEYT